MITLKNFYINTQGFFKTCEIPKRQPCFVSYKNFAEHKYIELENVKSLDMYVDRMEGPYDNIFIFKEKYKNILESLFKLQFYHKPNARMAFDINIIIVEGYGVSSLYWYDSDEKGEYIIRHSDHWGDVASCEWEIDDYSYRNRPRTGKAYLKDFKNIN